MMPPISDRTPEWRAGLRMDAQRMQSLWAAVALNAINESAHAVRKALKSGNADRAKSEIRRFRAWVKSRDAADVFALAGIEHSEKAVETLCATVKSGTFSAYALRNGGRNLAS